MTGMYQRSGRSRTRGCLRSVHGTETWSEFETMGPKTPCPDQMLLRLLFSQAASTPQAGSLQVHLEQCEVCQAIVAGLEDEKNIQNTVADEGVVPAKPVMPSTDATVFLGMINSDTE